MGFENYQFGKINCGLTNFFLANFLQILVCDFKLIYIEKDGALIVSARRTNIMSLASV